MLWSLLNRDYLSTSLGVISPLVLVFIYPCPYLKEGDKVVIKKGSLKGVEGYIVEKRDKNTVLVISIDPIGSSVKCIVPVDYVNSA
jgi:hypothetical protein